MSEAADRPNTIPWPPLIYGVAILASVALSYWSPLPWFGSPLGDILFVVGLLAIGAALAISVSALRALRRHGTTVHPNRATDHLVTDGPFALSRNPLYLSNTLLMFGVGLAAGMVWFILLGLVAALATQKLGVEREERHLEHRFGKRWRDYAKRVRRWI